MANENKPKSQPLPGQYEEEDLDCIPEHLVGSVRAIGDAVAAGGLKCVPISSSPGTRNSPEDLAKLVDRLQKTFGAGGSANGGLKGNVAPPPSPFAPNHDAAGGKTGLGQLQRSRYHAHMEEIQDEHLAKKP